jgi:tRNA (guanine26-N2/guanine27-N2)-dimethyltransferase
MLQTITEGKATIAASVGKVERTMEVFYNPAMRMNRDISVLVLDSLALSDLNIALPLAGSGVRGIRYKLELRPGVVAALALNDHSALACKQIEENLKRNRITDAAVHNLDASEFLLSSLGFDLIDLDPFGTPNPFLDSAVRRLSRRGILAITATDIAPLAGTYPDACMRKYWAHPNRDHMMHETGLRILIRKIQLIGAQYERALVPMYCFSRDHYFRLFLRSVKGKKAVDDVLAQHGTWGDRGPLWLGPLWESALAEKVAIQNKEPAHHAFLSAIAQESRVAAVGFHDIHSLARVDHTLPLIKKQDIIESLRKDGIDASETHFLGTGIRCAADEALFLKVVRSIRSRA